MGYSAVVRDDYAADKRRGVGQRRIVCMVRSTIHRDLKGLKGWLRHTEDALGVIIHCVIGTDDECGELL